MTIKEQIITHENSLLSAIENKNIEVIKKLLHDKLIFNIPTGQTINKQTDIENLQLGILHIESITQTDQIITVIDDIATVAVTLALNGKYDGNTIHNNFRYLRVWKQFGNSWKVIAGSGIQLK